MKKRALAILLALVMLLGMFPVTALAADENEAEAKDAGEGTMVTNAVEVTFGETYYKYWTKDTDHLNHYVKFEVPATGIVNIQASKPFDSEGEYGEIIFTVYDEDVETVWQTETRYSVDNASPNYKFNVGLKPGTYYMTMKPDFYVTSGVIETYYTLKYTKDPYCEVEPNGSAARATPLVFGQITTGYFGDDGSYSGDKEDWYCVDLVAGCKYDIAFGNYDKVSGTSTIEHFYLPDGTQTWLSSLGIKNRVNADGMNYCTYTPKITGRYYIQLYNYSEEQYKYTIRVNDYPEGWKKIDGKWYYYVDGVKVTGWQWIEGSRYYFDSTGAMQTGWLKDGGSWYYLKSTGAMTTGWKKISGTYYYFNGNGVMQTGWVKDGGKWYYMKSSGAMVTGWYKISGKWYYFASTGAMKTGWAKIDGKWYYFNSSGAMQVGWLYLKGSWYYLKSSGEMVTGSYTIGGVEYFFDENGVLIE